MRPERKDKEQRSANFSCQVPGRKYFQLRGPYSYLALLLLSRSSQRQSVNKCRELLSNRPPQTSFTKQSVVQTSHTARSLQTPAPEKPQKPLVLHAQWWHLPDGVTVNLSQYHMRMLSNGHRALYVVNKCSLLLLLCKNHSDRTPVWVWTHRSELIIINHLWNRVSGCCPSSWLMSL